MKISWMICIFILLKGLLYGFTEIETLKQKLQISSSEERLAIKLQIAEALFRSNPEEARKYASRAEIAAQASEKDFELGSARRIMGNIYYINRDYSKAAGYYRAALQSALNSQDDKLIGNLYYNLGRSYTGLKDYPQAYDNLQRSLLYRQKLPEREDEAASFNSIGLLFWEQQKYQQAILYFQTAVSLDNETISPRLWSAIYNNLGNALLKSGDTAGAGEAYVVSLKIKDTFGSDRELATANLNLGNLYYTATNYPKALFYYETAQKLYNTIEDEISEALVSSNIGSVFNDLNDPEKALVYHQAALQVFRENDMRRNIGKTLNNIGNAYLKKKDYSLSLDYYEEAIAVKELMNDTEGIAITQNNISETLFMMGDLASAIINVEKSYENALKVNNQKIQLNNLIQFAKIYEALGELELAVRFFKDYIELDLEVYAGEKKDAIAEMMVRFDAERKDEELIELKSLKELQEAKIAKQIRTNLRIVFIVIVLSAVTLSLGLLYRAKQTEVKKRMGVQKDLETLNRELEAEVEKALAEYRIQQQIIAQKSKLESLGNLAAGIAHEINQPLSALSMSIDNIQLKSGKGLLNDEYLKNKVLQVREDIQRIRLIIEHVRLFSRDQKDSIIEKIDINHVIRNALSLCKHEMSGLKIGLDLHLYEKTLYVLGSKYKFEQVLLNLINNAKDGLEEIVPSGNDDRQKKEIKIATKIEHGLAIVEIKDNGAGIPQEIIDKVYDPFFTTKTPDKGTGLGLSISYGIITEMDGEILIESRSGEFTLVTLRFPCLKEIS